MLKLKNCAIALILSICMFASALAVPASYSEASSSKTATDEKTLNSIALLNYIVFLTTKINKSENSRRYLEEVYSLIYNNTDPSVIDPTSQVRLTSLLDTIQKCRMTNVKRERLQYIYEENKAQAIRSAIPNPMDLLNAVQSRSLIGIVASVAYMSVDSLSSYGLSKEKNELNYLKDGWTLDDEQLENLHDSRKSTFSYMIDMSRDYGIPGEMILNENSIEDFVKWEKNANVKSRIQFLEDNKAKYKMFGNYWLVLARSYFESKQYDKCLESVEEYEKLKIRIFRKDHDLASILPMALASLDELNKNKKINNSDYKTKMMYYTKLLEENIESDDWSSKYILAQTNINLYGRTNEKKYLESAYKLALDNVNSLKDTQIKLNKEYLKDVEEEKCPEKASKQEKNEIKQYNKMRKEKRKTEVPPVYEPLELNCELLFSLSDKIEVKESEKSKVEEILRGKGDEQLFLTEPIDDMFRYDTTKDSNAYSDVIFTDKTIEVPAYYVSDFSDIKVTVKDSGKEKAYTDWTVSKVERPKSKDIHDFKVIYECNEKEFGKQKYNDNTTVRVLINPGSSSSNDDIVAEFKVINKKLLGHSFERY